MKNLLDIIQKYNIEYQTFPNIETINIFINNEAYTTYQSKYVTDEKDVTFVVNNIAHTIKLDDLEKILLFLISI